jgi:hypothetical protein
VFDDPMACYMENPNNKNLRLMIGCKLRNGDDDQSTSALKMDCFIPGSLFQPTLPLIQDDCCFHQSQQIIQPLDENQQGKSHENQNAVEEIKHNCCFRHVLEDPFCSFD